MAVERDVGLVLHALRDLLDDLCLVADFAGALGGSVLQFDGWPAIVFSGWPNTSYGTYGGQIFAIDNFISDNGKYRVLVAPDPKDPPWPEALRVGSGTTNLLLLKEVTIGYELWRKLNGFPPDYYKTNTSHQKLEM